VRASGPKAERAAAQGQAAVCMQRVRSKQTTMELGRDREKRGSKYLFKK